MTTRQQRTEWLRRACACSLSSHEATAAIAEILYAAALKLVEQ